MPEVTLRFYAELGDFLSPEQRQVDFTHRLVRKGQPVKEVIEALGVPPIEVELILVNGRSVDFSYPIGEGDRISVFPVFESFDIRPLLRVRGRPLRESRFVLGERLGELGRLLRSLGFDVLQREDCDNQELIRLSIEKRRILLTCDPTLIDHPVLTHAYHVKESEAERQLEELLLRLDLDGRDAETSVGHCQPSGLG